MKKKKNQDNRIYTSVKKFDDSFNSEIEKSYESILFLGTSLFSDLDSFNNQFLSTYIFVMKYFIEKKDFSKVESIIEILLLKDEVKKFNIDSQILETIHVSLN
jgi:hypothetical protein